MITKDELKELAKVLNYYVIAGLCLGIMVATVAVNGGVILVRSNYGLPLTTKALSAMLMILIGLMTSLSAYLVLLPAELKLARRKLRPQVLRRRLSGKK